MDHDVDLTERRRTHGDFTVHASITQSLKRVTEPYRNRLSDTQREAIDMIFHKIGRICAGDPNVLDHWVDIVGYARITIERIDPEGT